MNSELNNKTTPKPQLVTNGIAPDGYTLGAQGPGRNYRTAYPVGWEARGLTEHADLGTEVWPAANEMVWANDVGDMVYWLDRATDQIGLQGALAEYKEFARWSHKASAWDAWKQAISARQS